MLSHILTTVMCMQLLHVVTCVLTQVHPTMSYIPLVINDIVSLDYYNRMAFECSTSDISIPPKSTGDISISPKSTREVCELLRRLGVEKPK